MLPMFSSIPPLVLAPGRGRGVWKFGGLPLAFFLSDILDHISALPLPTIAEHYLARFLLLTTHIHPNYYTSPSHFMAAEPI